MPRDYVIRIEGLVNGGDSAYDGMYLTRFDFEGCALGECNLLAAQKPPHALRFPSMSAAMGFYMTIDPRAPLRGDGQLNRPLTTFSVTIEPIEEP